MQCKETDGEQIRVGARGGPKLLAKMGSLTPLASAELTNHN